MNINKRKVIDARLAQVLDESDLVGCNIETKPRLNKEGRKVTVITLVCEKDPVYMLEKKSL